MKYLTLLILLGGMGCRSHDRPDGRGENQPKVQESEPNGVGGADRPEHRLDFGNPSDIRLKAGMTLADVVDVLGEPDVDIGFGNIHAAWEIRENHWFTPTFEGDRVSKVEYRSSPYESRDRACSRLKVGMTYKEVVDLLGEPDYNLGDAIIIAYWEIRENHWLVPAFDGNRLTRIEFSNNPFGVSNPP